MYTCTLPFRLLYSSHDTCSSHHCYLQQFHLVVSPACVLLFRFQCATQVACRRSLIITATVALSVECCNGWARPLLTCCPPPPLPPLCQVYTAINKFHINISVSLLNLFTCLLSPLVTHCKFPFHHIFVLAFVHSSVLSSVTRVQYQYHMLAYVEFGPPRKSSLVHFYCCCCVDAPDTVVSFYESIKCIPLW